MHRTALLALVLLLASALCTVSHARYVVGIWPGSSCDENNFHSASVSNVNQGCYYSGVNDYNIYASLKLYMVTCNGDSASSTWRMQGMREYCNVYNLDFTGSGNGCVRWGGYGAIDASVRISCDNKGWPGFLCTNNGGDAFCSTGICRTRCCNAGTDSGCATCSTNGQCTACAAGYVLSGGNKCMKANGVTCATNQECLSSSCVGRCCAQSLWRCAACDSNGVCVSCPAGTTLISSGCKTADGDYCSAGADCFSGRCLGSRCCSSAGVDSNCGSCNATGVCIGCSSQYYALNGTTCLRTAGSAGAPPSSSDSNGASGLGGVPSALFAAFVLGVAVLVVV